MSVRRLVLLFALLLTSTATAEDLPFVHPLFTPHMVFQRNMEAPVWGWTEPQATVTVSMNGKSATATADASGRWEAKLGPFEAGGPFELKIDGPQTVTIGDVLIGDVWVCSGQSNMEWPVAASNEPDKEIAAASYPNLRLFTVPKRVSLEPQQTVDAQWTVCSPETIGGFSAVGFFFGRGLHKKLDVPIGLVHTSWGGTIAEAWTSAEALETMDDFRPAVKQLRATVQEQSSGSDSFDERMAAWWKKYDRGSSDGWSDPDADDADWKSMTLPANWEDAGLPDYDGVAWFRRDVTLDDAWKQQPATLNLGPIDDQDTVWVNGREVGSTWGWNSARSYSVPPGVLQAGENTIAIRVLDTGGGGGVYGTADQMVLESSDSKAAPTRLAGEWRYRETVRAEASVIQSMPQRLGEDPNVTTVLYNGMIAPLLPYGIKGAIWYQGESNAGRPEQYRTLLPTMIRDWRSRFGAGEFPFLIVQLANFMQPQQQPVEDGWAMLREAQWLTAKADPNTGLAVITDIGEANDIHPRNKQDVGWRLALQALSIAYDRDVVSSGPEFESVEFHGNEAHVKFTSVGSGLETNGDELKGFAIAAETGNFVWADAKIHGDTVVLTGDGIDAPARVRYGWANNPSGNLFNKEGLPAGPFRTDLDKAARALIDTTVE